MNSHAHLFCDHCRYSIHARTIVNHVILHSALKLPRRCLTAISAQTGVFLYLNAMEQEIIDLSHLTAEERAKLVAVIEADEELRLQSLR